MGLGQIQIVLARLYTDAELRQRFEDDPVGVARSLVLDSEDAQTLAAISRKQLDLFAQSLQRKRLGQVSKMLPLSRRALGERFQELFLEYVLAGAAAGKKPAEDALGFAAFVERIHCANRVAPVHAVEMMRFESAWLSVLAAQRRWAIRKFHYPVGALARDHGRDEATAPQSRRTIGVWFRLTRYGRVRHIMLSRPF